MDYTEDILCALRSDVARSHICWHRMQVPHFCNAYRASIRHVVLVISLTP